MEERDLDSAADDGVNPEPPPCAEHGAGYPRPHDLPHQSQLNMRAASEAKIPKNWPSDGVNSKSNESRRHGQRDQERGEGEGGSPGR
ncbi:hypothetical protein C4D60_Mb08t23540 [Musa balbisiana]|uniref:Uncharacterized protein n=1 Tax=Musa balbisiana TaxID=52838 RepID=A0A4S8K5Z3_MUSBA|nr:hypothetical protein C4D60_Mb08t23540 [Musa balbisiana]